MRPVRGGRQGIIKQHNNVEDTRIATLIKPDNSPFAGKNVRLVGAEGEQVGIVSFEEARAQAAAIGMDLVIVADQADPPVIRIMDYGKLRYEKKKNLKAQKKKQHTQKLKEIKFHVRTDKHDLEYKINHAREFLGKSYKLKISLQFRGREMAHKELGFELIKNVITELEDYGQADSPPKIIGRSISTTISPLSAKNQRARAKAREQAALNSEGHSVELGEEFDEDLEMDESIEHAAEKTE